MLPGPPPSAEVRATSRELWTRFSITKLIVISVCFGAAVFAIGIALDYWLVREHESRRLIIEISDAFTGLIAGLLALQALLYWRVREQNLLRKMETIADMNHHVRNALQVIALYSELPPDEKRLKAIRDSVKRIQWALREILPKM